jgi:DNA mismatch repair protein MutL
MPDIIQLLPDTVANQIAAGEVIQRPASVVKELLENAIDAGAARIKLIVKDAGRSLIQLIDDGKGMSETDARMAFERHATSKIKTADDLFKINTKGFRGEALASIAAIAQVELKTRQESDAVGTQIIIEGNKLISQQPVASASGTSFTVKNLFFNVPARRNFLKSNQVELGHIIDEFQRVALTHPEISFVLTHNDNEIFHLEKSTLRQRIVNIFGGNYNERLVPVNEDTDLVKFSGFVGKPQFAKKSRGEQFFFINKRFVKNNYLHHAVCRAFEQLLPAEHTPSYFIYLEVDPSFIDINIHPTKTEIKFEDEKAVYALLRSCIRRSLGIYNIAPTLDFDQEASINFLPPNASGPINPPEVKINPGFNPFEAERKNDSRSPASSMKKHINESLWEHPLPLTGFIQPDENTGATELPFKEEESLEKPASDEQQEWEAPSEKQSQKAIVLGNNLIVTTLKTGLLIVNAVYARQRILFEQFMFDESRKIESQKLVFPVLTHLTVNDLTLLESLREELSAHGFVFDSMGGQSIAIHGIPGFIKESETLGILEQIIEHFRSSGGELRNFTKEQLAKSFAESFVSKSMHQADEFEIRMLIDELFACREPYMSPSGKPTVITYSLEEIIRKFKS